MCDFLFFPKRREQLAAVEAVQLCAARLLAIIDAARSAHSLVLLCDHGVWAAAFAAVRAVRQRFGPVAPAGLVGI